MTIDPVVLFCLLGLAAGLPRADLRLPPAIYEFLTTLLLLTIGQRRIRSVMSGEHPRNTDYRRIDILFIGLFLVCFSLPIRN